MPSKSAEVAACPHCGAAVAGSEDAFCCAGCEAADALIRGAGLEEYYRSREALPPRPDTRVSGWETVPVERNEDGTCSVRLQVDGLRCASCVWVTEGVLSRADGVEEAHVSYATGRTLLRWDADRTDLPALVSRIQALGYRPRLLGEERRPDRSLLVRLGVATFVALNVMLLHASIYAGWLDGMAPRFVSLFQWASLALTTPVALWAASPFFAGAWAGIRKGYLHMDLPIALAVSVLYGHGFVVTVFTGGESYLDSLAMLVALLLAGRVLEGHGRRRAAEAATSLAAELPATGRRITADGGVETVPAETLRSGDRVALGAGEEFPADGVIRAGSGHAGMALVTGESVPRTVEEGDEVYGGTLLVDGAVEVVVTASGEEATVHRMARTLQEAASRPMTLGTADRIAPWFTLATLVVAAGTLVGWGVTAGWEPALTATVAVLVVACPCALALSGPLTTAAGLGAAARRGLLLRSPDGLQRLAGVDTVALDKTGTVTAGEMTILEADDETLRIAAGLERFSGHPIARAVVREAVARRIPLPKADEVEEEPGIGVRGRVDGRRWRLRPGGPGELLLLDDAGPRGSLRLGDAIRPDAVAAVNELRAMGLTVQLRTGDHAGVAREVAAATGISDWRAGMKPDEKEAAIREEQAAGRRVLYAGDGINDGPALAAAHASVAMGTGSAASILVADGVVGTEALAPVVSGIRAARVAERAVRQSQVRSIAYNVAAVGLAAAGWVNPLVAAVLMPLSSALVVAGAAGVEAQVGGQDGTRRPGPGDDRMAGLDGAAANPARDSGSVASPDGRAAA